MTSLRSCATACRNSKGPELMWHCKLAEQVTEMFAGSEKWAFAFKNFQTGSDLALQSPLWSVLRLPWLRVWACFQELPSLVRPCVQEPGAQALSKSLSAPRGRSFAIFQLLSHGFWGRNRYCEATSQASKLRVLLWEAAPGPLKTECFRRCS